MSCESTCGGSRESRGWMRQHEIMPRTVQLPDGTYALSLGNQGGRTQSAIETTAPRYWEQKTNRESKEGDPIVVYDAGGHSQAAD